MRAVFKKLFDPTAAQVALIDLEGVILETNRAWKQFGRDNGLSPHYECSGKNYLHVCEAAAEINYPGAREAYLGLLSVIRADRPKFTIVYPCDSPTERRLMRMWVEPQMPQLRVIVVAHYLRQAAPIDADIESAMTLIHPSPESYNKIANDRRAQDFQQPRKF